MWKIVRKHPKKTILFSIFAFEAIAFWYIFYWDCTYFAKEVREGVMVRNGTACVRLPYSSYSDWIEIEGADPYTIRASDATVLNLFQDKDSVYVRDKKIDGADPATLEEATTGSKYMWKDKNHVYVGDKVSPADPKTVQNLDGSYYKDYKGVYYYDVSTVPSADPDSFETIGQHAYYAKDKNRVYFEDIIVDGADPETFGSVVKNGYYFWKDKNSVYFRGKSVQGVDRETFVELERGKNTFGRDKFRCYEPILDIDGYELKIHDLSRCQ